MHRAAFFAGGFLLLSLFLLIEQQNGPWVAPEEANQLVNPIKGNTEEGNRIYDEVCWKCHGDKGNGKGPAAPSTNPSPADFTSEKVQSQTDGALFWKLSEGRGPMASYKTKYTEQQRWSLVNRIRKFKK